MVALVIVSTFVVLVLGILVAGLLRSHADILRSLHDLGAGVGDPTGSRPPPSPVPVTCHARRRARRSVPAPAVAGVTPTGDARAVAVDNSDDLTLLGFLSSGCTGCAAFWDALQEPGAPAAARPHPRRDRHQGPDREVPAEVRARATGRVPVVMSTDAWLDYQVPGSPFFVLVDGATGRKVGQGVASQVGQLAELVRRAEHDRGHGGGTAAAAVRARSAGRPARRRPTRCWRRPASSRVTRASIPRTLDDVFPHGHARAGRVVATIGAHGITARLPDGFEGRIFVRPAAVGVTYPVGQFATFPIPDDIGDFGERRRHR